MSNTVWEHQALSTQEMECIQPVLEAFGLKGKLEVKPFGNGLINRTWKVITINRSFILQKINQQVFTKPEYLTYNVRLLADYIAQHDPRYLFVAPVSTADGADLVLVEGKGYFRLFVFVENSFTKNVVETPEQAYEAAKQFGKFTRLLSGFNAHRLKTTIPNFHNLSLRYQQFLIASEKGNSERIRKSRQLIQQLKGHADIVSVYERIKANPQFRMRVTHHDTKISNVLFDADDKGLCVIDLDTVMPGHFISDVGDMLRTYLSPVNEEETDFSKIEVREDFYKAVVQGYYSDMNEELTETEKKSFFYAGKFMIYMQALRFLTDHLNNDVYYGAIYEGHNLARATNQTVLLEQLIKNQVALNILIK